MKDLRNNGFILVPFLASIVVLIAIYAGARMMIRSSRVTERGIASEMELATSLDMIDILTSDPQTCAKSGLIGLVIDPHNPTVASVSLSYPLNPTPSPSPKVFLQETKTLGTLQTVTRMRFIDMQDMGADALYGGELYQSTLQIATANLGQSYGPQSKLRTKQISLVLDATNKVVACFGMNRCPAGQAVSGMSAQGTFSCASTHARAFDSGWINIPNVAPYTVTVTHNLGTMNYKAFVEWTTSPLATPTPVVSQLANLYATFDAAGALTQNGFSSSDFSNKTPNTIDVGAIGQYVDSSGVARPLGLPPGTRARVHLTLY